MFSTYEGLFALDVVWAVPSADHCGMADYVAFMRLIARAGAKVADIPSTSPCFNDASNVCVEAEVGCD